MNQTSPEPTAGLSARSGLVVTSADTAIAFGSGALPVVATPRLIALCEQATCRAVDGVIADESTTVGTRVEFDHTAASPVGAEVVAIAELLAVEGRRLRFAVRVTDGGHEVGHGIVERVIVMRDRFLSRLADPV